MATYVSKDEVVLDPSYATSEKEIQEILKHNERAKVLRAERRDRERCETPTLIEKFARGIKKLFGLAQAKQIEQQQQNQGKSR